MSNDIGFGEGMLSGFQALYYFSSRQYSFVGSHLGDSERQLILVGLD